MMKNKPSLFKKGRKFESKAGPPDFEPIPKSLQEVFQQSRE